MKSSDITIRLKDVAISYLLKRGFMQWSKYTPLKNISFQLYRGETLGVIGRNGAGKSTLLRIIAGIIDADAGQVINYGARVSLLSLGVGFMPHLSGRENAVLNGMLLGLSKCEIQDRINAIVEFSELGDFFEQPLRTYSSGMRVRLAFSIAMQINPDVLLVDEVLGVGDEQFRIKSTAAMKELIKSDKTVVLVSHQIAVVRELCDRVLWIENGVVKMLGNTADVLEKYLAYK